MRNTQADRKPNLAPRLRLIYVYMPPALGIGMARCPIHDGIRAQSIVASTTASGSEAPAKRMGGERGVAVAAAGAMAVIDWNNTPGKPIASLLSVVPPVSTEVVVFDVDKCVAPLLKKRPAWKMRAPNTRHRYVELNAPSRALVINVRRRRVFRAPLEAAHREQDCGRKSRVV